jgi:hypothetical protein
MKGKKRGRRHGHCEYSKRQFKPNQKQFYPPKWQDFLDEVKWVSRTRLTTVNAFPNKENEFNITLECLESVLEIYVAEGKYLDPGM